MIKKKNKFLTFCFSLIPGAGHMYLGFMKQGISLLTAFFTIIMLCSWLNLGALLFVLPVIWFFGFFDATNKASLSDEEFYSLEDNYFIPMSDVNLNKIFQKRGFHMIVAIILIFIGCNLLLDALYYSVIVYLPDAVSNLYHSLSQLFPRLVFGSFIVAIGVKLILGKKSELETPPSKTVVMPDQYYTDESVDTQTSNSERNDTIIEHDDIKVE